MAALLFLILFNKKNHQYSFNRISVSVAKLRLNGVACAMAKIHTLISGHLCNGTTSRKLIETVSPNLLPKYTVLELNSKNVPLLPSHARKDRKIEGEKLFGQVHSLLKKVLPDQGDTKRELRKWLHEESTKSTFFHVAIDPEGKAVGTAITEYVPEMNLAFFLRIAVHPDHRRQGIARLLVKERTYRANQLSIEDGKKGLRYSLTLVLRPKIVEGQDADKAIMRNLIRLCYHEKVSNFRAIITPSGEIVGGKKYIFVIGNMRDPDAKFIEARETARLLHWNYINRHGYNESELGRQTFVEIINQVAWRPTITWEDVAKGRKKLVEAIPKHLQLELKPLTEVAMRDPDVKKYIDEHCNGKGGTQ